MVDLSISKWEKVRHQKDLADEFIGRIVANSEKKLKSEEHVYDSQKKWPSRKLERPFFNSMTKLIVMNWQSET